MLEKIKALVQWFMQLERSEHPHWCVFNWSDDDPPTYKRDEKRSACPLKGYRWDCKGLFCANVERKNCPACAEWDRVNASKIKKEAA